MYQPREREKILTEFALRNLKPSTALYKIADRDGMYVGVSPAGTISFRYDYRVNGRWETLTIGRYGRGGISLAFAREKLLDARRAVREGRSPAVKKQRERQRRAAAKTFGEWAGSWLKGGRMADTTRSVRKGILVRDILPAFNGRLLCEVTADDLRALCMRVKARGAPATAVQLRDIVKQIYAYANLHGEKVENPADEVGVASISTLVPKGRVLSPLEIRLMHRQLEQVATYPTIRLASRLILLTMVRKSELIEASWDEVDFEAAVWTIPKSRMKARRAHKVYLSRQSIDIMVPLEPFTVHDLRRTGSTLLNEAGFNGDWIERSLAHGGGGRSSRAVYNKAEYAVQRRHMLQADMVDAWAQGGGHRPNLLPSDMAMPTVIARAP